MRRLALSFAVAFLFAIGLPVAGYAQSIKNHPTLSLLDAIESAFASPIVRTHVKHIISDDGQLSHIVEASAARNGVPAELVSRIIRVESRGNCAADNGIAKGVMQVKPQTAASVGVYGSLKNCSTGVEAGARYLRLALDRSGGDWAGAATLYNAGIWARPHASRYSQMVLR